jgi:hypothetical protein
MTAIYVTCEIRQRHVFDCRVYVQALLGPPASGDNQKATPCNCMTEPLDPASCLEALPRSGGNLSAASLLLRATGRPDGFTAINLTRPASHISTLTYPTCYAADADCRSTVGLIEYRTGQASSNCHATLIGPASILTAAVRV